MSELGLVDPGLTGDAITSKNACSIGAEKVVSRAVRKTPKLRRQGLYFAPPRTIAAYGRG